MSSTIFLALLLTSGWISYGSASEYSYDLESVPAVLIDSDIRSPLRVRPLESGVPGGESEQDPNDPKFQKMAKDIVYSHLRIKEPDTKNITVYKATTQTVSGTVTKLKFRVFFVNGRSMSCSSDVWEQPWKNAKHISYVCDSIFVTKKLSLSSGDNSGPKKSRDPNNPKYQDLARAALKDWFATNAAKPFKESDVSNIRVTSVKTQLSSKITSHINFNVNTADNKNFKCTSKIIEKPWDPADPINFEIVQCTKSERGIKTKLNSMPGGQKEQDPDDPKYKQLAEESFRKYRKKRTGLLFTVKDYKVTKATTQVVSGIITRLDFYVIRDDDTSFPCQSEILEQSWRGKKDISVHCTLLFQDNKLLLSRPGSGLPGGETEHDPDDPEYKQLAEESFQEYRKKRTGLLFTVKDYKVTKATTQVVSGIITRLDFYVIRDDDTSFPCQSEILEQSWRGKKEISVHCTLLFQENKLSLSKPGSGLVGGEVERDPDDPEYKQLAEESFREYRNNHIGLLVKVKDYKVTRATVQLVAGVITRLDFNVITDQDKSFACHSSILDISWRKIKEITVDCHLLARNNKLSLSQSYMMGGETEKDPHDPQYKRLAEESFQKYRKTHIGPLYGVKEVRVIKVIEALAAGIITKIDFEVITDESRSFPCYSEVLVQGWLNKKDISVTCQLLKESNKKLSLSGRHEKRGGLVEQDPDDPEYKDLAKESIQRYLKSHTSNVIHVKDLKVTEVTTQVVSGIVTRIDFYVYPTKGRAFPCHSEILNDLNKLNFDVKCKLSSHSK